MSETLDIQRAVLGMILLDTEIQVRFEVMVKPQFFTDETCRLIYGAITEIRKQKGSIDTLTVFKKIKELKLKVTPDKLNSLTSKVAGTQKFDEYCLILQDYFIKDELVRRCSEIVLFSTETRSAGIEIADKLQQSIQELVSLQWTNDKVKDSQKLVQDAHDRYEQRKIDRINGIPSGIDTGSRKLNDYIGGWQKGHLAIIGGRPGMGKSRMMLQHFWAAADSGAYPLFFTLEMPESDVMDVMVVAQSSSRFNPRDHKNGSLTDSEYATKESVESILSSKQYYLSGERNLNQIRAISQRHIREKGTKVIFIDFLQKIEPSGKHNNKNSAVTEVAEGLKNLAKDLDIPVIAIASLSRAVEERGGLKQPEQQDLRESGTIESEADLILFAWRPAYYEFENPETNQPYTNEFYYLHGKGRFNGASDLILYHDKYMARFYDEPNGFDTYETKPLSNLQPNVNFHEKNVRDGSPF